MEFDLISSFIVFTFTVTGNSGRRDTRAVADYVTSCMSQLWLAACAVMAFVSEHRFVRKTFFLSFKSTRTKLTRVPLCTHLLGAICALPSSRRPQPAGRVPSAGGLTTGLQAASRNNLRTRDNTMNCNFWGMLRGSECSLFIIKITWKWQKKSLMHFPRQRVLTQFLFGGVTDKLWLYGNHTLSPVKTYSSGIECYLIL